MSKNMSVNDYLLIAVDSESKLAIRFACLDQLIPSVLATHNPQNSSLQEKLLHLVAASVLLGSRQDEQQTLLFKLSFAQTALRMNCEVSSLGATRVAVYPELPGSLPEPLLVEQLSVTTLTRNNEVYESHVYGKTVLMAFEQYLAQSQQSRSLLFLPDVESRQREGFYALWVEKLPGTDESMWQEIITHLSMSVWVQVQKETDPDRILQLLFPGGFRILAMTRPTLTCTCNRDKVLSSLTLLDEADLADIFMDGNGISTRCDYCHKEWHVSDEEIRTILKIPPVMQ